MYRPMFTQDMWRRKNTGVSFEFRKHFNHVPLAHFMPRVVIHKHVERVDNGFIEYAKNRGMPVPPDKWRVPLITTEKGYEEAARYWAPTVVEIDDEILTAAKRLLKDHLRSAMKGAGVVTADDVKNSMVTSTSPGFGYNQLVQTKAEAMELDFFDNNFWNFFAALETDKPIPDPLQSTSKWELRKVGKAPRTFMTGGLHTHIVHSMLYKSQGEAMVKNHDTLWSAVGISQYHGGWDRLYRQLKIVGSDNPLFLSADVSGWDRDMPAELLEATRDVLFQLLPKHDQTPRWEKISKTLAFMNAFGPVVLERGEIVNKIKGMGSGLFITILKNTIGHILVDIYAFLHMMGKDSWRRMTVAALYERIFTNIWMKCVGDDEVGAINQDRYPWFTQEGYAEAYKHFGFTMKVCDVSTRLEDLSYLSCRWVLRSSTWCAIPDREKVLCQIAYGGKKDDPKSQYLRVLSLQQACWPDKELYELVRDYAVMYKRTHLSELQITREGELTFFEIECAEMSDADVEALHVGTNQSLKHLELIEEEDFSFKQLVIEESREQDIVVGVLQEEGPVDKYRGKGAGWKSGFVFSSVLEVKLNAEQKREVVIPQCRRRTKREELSLSQGAILQRKRRNSSLISSMPKIKSAIREAANYAAKKAMRNAPKGKSKKKNVGRFKPRGKGRGGRKNFGKMSSAKGQAPTRARSGMYIPFEEIIGTVTSSSDGSFKTTFMKMLNPGLSPELSPPVAGGILDGLSTYLAQPARINLRHSLCKPGCGLTVRLRTRASDFTGGKHGITIVYDAKHPQLTSSVQAENHAGTKWKVPHKDVVVSFDKKFGVDDKLKLIRTGLPAGVIIDGDAKTSYPDAFDLQQYDYGFVQVWSEGVTNATGTPAAVVTADVIVKGVWWVGERDIETALETKEFPAFGTDHYQWTTPAVLPATGTSIESLKLPPSPLLAPLPGSNAGTLLVYGSSADGSLVFSLPTAGLWNIKYRGVCRTLTPGDVAEFWNGIPNNFFLGGSVSPVTLMLDDTTGVTGLSQTINSSGFPHTQEWVYDEYFNMAAPGVMQLQSSSTVVAYVATGIAPFTFGIGLDIFLTKINDTLTKEVIKKQEKEDEEDIAALLLEFRKTRKIESVCTTPVVVASDGKEVAKKWEGKRSVGPEIDAKQSAAGVVQHGQVIGESYFAGEKIKTRVVDDSVYAKLFGPQRSKSLDRDQKDDSKTQTKRDEKGKG